MSQILNQRIDWSLVQTWGARIGAALLILLVTHFIAKAVQWAFAKAIDRIPLLQRHTAAGSESVGKQVSSLAYWLVWLVGLVAALSPLGLSQVMTPINTLTSSVFAFIPNILAAVLIFVFGLIVATIARKVVETALTTMNLDRLLAQFQLAPKVGTTAAGRTALPKGAGILVYILIIIPVATAALQALGLSSLSVPLVAILQSIAAFLPKAVAAAFIVVIGFIIAGRVRSWTRWMLDAVGLDATMEKSGLLSRGLEASSILGMVAYAAVLLAVAIAAVDVLDIPSLRGMLSELMTLGAHVVFGTVIIIVGAMLARFLAGVAAKSGGAFAGTIIHYAILALAAAMGLRFMGLANDIVNLAFGLILGSAAVASALAFGLGGRDTAHKLLDRWTGGGPGQGR